MSAYRYEDIRYAGTDEGDRGYMRIELSEFDVLKTTPKGFWINAWTGKRFVRNEGKKRFACLSKSDAMTSFNARKQRQKSIYEARLADCVEAIELAKGLPKSP